MTEPLRLKHLRAGSPGAAALRAARAETPPAGAHERMLAALDVGLPPAPSSRISASRIHVRGSSRRRTWVWGAAVAALVSLVAAHELGAGRQAPAASMSRAAPRPAIAAAGTEPPEAPAGASNPALYPDVSAVTNESAHEVARAAPAPRPTAPPEGKAHEPSARGSRLSEEVMRLDAVRRALEAKEPERALSLLNGYARAFPSGNLATEAAVLHIEALLASGRRARAESAAREFLRANSRSSYAARIDRLFGGRLDP